MEGYNTFGGGVPQVNNPGKQTNIKVLCPPDTPLKQLQIKMEMKRKYQVRYMIMIKFIV